MSRRNPAPRRGVDVFRIDINLMSGRSAPLIRIITFMLAAHAAFRVDNAAFRTNNAVFRVGGAAQRPRASAIAPNTCRVSGTNVGPLIVSIQNPARN